MHFSPFLELAPEIRLIIYHHYFTEDNGYVFSHETGKLKTAGNQLIHLGLIFTCRRIAQETRNIPLAINTILFTPGCGDTSMKTRAENFYHAASDIEYKSRRVLGVIGRCITPDIYHQVMKEHPYMAEELDETLHSTGSPTAMFRGNVPSLQHQAIQFLINLVAHSDLQSVLTKLASSRAPGCLEALQICPEFWAIPPNETCKSILYHLRDRRPRVSNRMQSIRMAGGTYNFSAAAWAIHFLKSISPSSRLSLRNIRLHENAPSVAFPQCHAQGLIPFCKENPCLKIERRASLWKCVSQGAHSTDWDVGLMSWPVACWLVEAQALLQVGMPAESFVFVLDDEGANEATELFEKVIQRDLAWHQSFAECHRLNTGESLSYMRTRQYQCYLYKDFPHVMKDLVANANPMIRCNFYPGELWDVEQATNLHRDWTWDDWEIARNQCPTLTFDLDEARERLGWSHGN